MEIYKWIVLGALGCTDNEDFEKKNNTVLNVFIICHKLRHAQVI